MSSSPNRTSNQACWGYPSEYGQARNQISKCNVPRTNRTFGEIWRCQLRRPSRLGCANDRGSEERSRAMLMISEPKRGTPSRVPQKLKLRVARKLRKRERSGCAAQTRFAFDEAGEPLRAFWHARFYDFSVYTRRKQIEKLNYMHTDPVTREPMVGLGCKVRVRQMGREGWPRFRSLEPGSWGCLFFFFPVQQFFSSIHCEQRFSFSPIKLPTAPRPIPGMLHQSALPPALK